MAVYAPRTGGSELGGVADGPVDGANRLDMIRPTATPDEECRLLFGLHASLSVSFFTCFMAIHCLLFGDEILVKRQSAEIRFCPSVETELYSASNTKECAVQNDFTSTVATQ